MMVMNVIDAEGIPDDLIITREQEFSPLPEHILILSSTSTKSLLLDRKLSESTVAIWEIASVWAPR